jgi:hypothetical protein
VRGTACEFSRRSAAEIWVQGSCSNVGAGGEGSERLEFMHMHARRLYHA